MGMYTEFFFSARIENDEKVISILKRMIGVNRESDAVAEHPLFAAPRWEGMLQCCSHYFNPITVHALEFNAIAGSWSFVTLSSFKNYDNEIALFLDWLMPYVDSFEGEMLGYYRYEENREPTIIYKKGA